MTKSQPTGSLSRRGFALGAASVVVAAPAIVRAQGLTKIKITQPSESLSYMPIYIARGRDLFKEAGLDVQVVITRGDGPDVQALMAKEVEFVATPPHHLYTLALQNQKLLGVCGILGRCGINLVISKAAAKERGITENSSFDDKLKALKGLTIGASAPGSLTFNLPQYYVQRAGSEPADRRQGGCVGTGAAAIPAMKNNIVNAYSLLLAAVGSSSVHLHLADWLINDTAPRTRT